MTSKALAEFLTKHAHCTREGDRLQVPETVRATLFASFGGDPILVEPVRTVELSGDAAIVHTGRGERYLLLCADIRALRFADASNKAGIR